MAERLSSRQREVLEMVAAACEPVDTGVQSERIVPLYDQNLPNELFWTEREREKFLQNLERRGLIRIHKRFFLYITDAGLTALGKEPAS